MIFAYNNTRFSDQFPGKLGKSQSERQTITAFAAARDDGSGSDTTENLRCANPQPNHYHRHSNAQVFQARNP